MSKLSNTFIMLQLLSTGRKYNIKELAEKLEVSERMIRIYKEDLEKAGIFIDTIMGPYGGYVLNQEIKLPQIGHENNYKKGTSLILTGETLKKYNILTHALQENKRVKILYNSFKHKELERIIQPAEMFLFKGSWYCAAFCELRQDMRHFELKRILKYELL